jgi:hypothetical protein
VDEQDAELLRRARDELYSLRTVIAPLRNRATTAVAALTDAEARADELIRQLEARLNGSLRPKEAPGHEPRSTQSTEAHEQDRVGTS